MIPRGDPSIVPGGTPPRLKIRGIRGCARCGGSHAVLWAKRFDRPPPTDHAFWATCPTSGDPILVRWDGDFDGAEVVR